jgi:serine/threonine-protein kinase RsbW
MHGSHDHGGHRRKLDRRPYREGRPARAAVNEAIVKRVIERNAHGARRPLSMQLRATPASVGAARRALALYCEQQGAPRETTDAVLLSVSEAVTNALVHAYRHLDEPAAERIELEARCDGGALVVVVRDFGCGMAPRLDSPGLGLGLPLIAASTSSVQIDTPPGGGRTEISMEFPLLEPALEI